METIIAASRLEALGCVLDEAKNKAVSGTLGVISTDNSKTPAIVIPTNEELMIARHTRHRVPDFRQRGSERLIQAAATASEASA